jgi:hypothetical protein
VCWQEPNILDPAGRPWLKFGKLTTPGQSRQLLINVRNNGLLPATARIEMEPHPAFRLLEGTQVFTVESKKASTFTTQFVPPEHGSFSHELHLNVNNNPFEQYKVALTGGAVLLAACINAPCWDSAPRLCCMQWATPCCMQHTCDSRLLLGNSKFQHLSVSMACVVCCTGDCAEEEVLFLGLPAGGITLPDVHLAPPAPSGGSSGGGGGSQRPPSSLAQHKEPASHAAAASAGAALSAAAGLPAAQIPPGSSSSSFTFSMVNNSSNKHFRYKWPDHPHLKFYPSVGHLHAGQSRAVTVTFVASVPVRLDNQDIKVALSQITYKVRDWHVSLSRVVLYLQHSPAPTLHPPGRNLNLQVC